MLTQIKTIEDVQAFAGQLIADGVSFHPDDDFNDYVFFKENNPCYTKEEADFRNTLMQQCFDICAKSGADIYGIMLEITLLETGMDKYIPLPSQPLISN
ncbi:MAG TPA: hypothetical protein VLC98_10660 [Phnomibacter sp.]|nr:hypothetical protein [Phnomibacter sp.]